MKGHVDSMLTLTEEKDERGGNYWPREQVSDEAADVPVTFSAGEIALGLIGLIVVVGVLAGLLAANWALMVRWLSY